MQEKIKILLKYEAKGLLRWHTYQRFNGHDEKEKNIRKCHCEEQPTLTQKHIVQCRLYAQVLKEAHQKSHFPNLYNSLTTFLLNPNWEEEELTILLEEERSLS